MDRLAQTALSAIRQMQDLKYDLAHNLANVNVPGFRRDLPNEGGAGFLEQLNQLTAKRKQALEEAQREEYSKNAFLEARYIYGAKTIFVKFQNSFEV